LLGIAIVIFIVLAYICYAFSNFFFFIPVINEINQKNTAVLITLHNEGELRPNLGFLTGFIIIKKDENGEISMNFHDSYDIAAPEKPIVAPDVIERNFSADSRYQGWVFRDSNFDMQYSNNAKNAIALLQYDKRYKDIHISAVVSLDMHAIEDVLDSIGGVEFQWQKVYGENFFSVMESGAKQFDRSDEEAWKNRKSGVKPLAVAILKKSIKNVSAWKNLSNTVEDLFREKHILFYSPQPKIQKIFSENDIAGEIILNKNNIPWGINIANIGGKKGDRYITKNVKSTFSFDANGKVTEKMRIQFSHNGTRNLHSDRYFGYVRIIKTKNANLVHFKKSKNFINKPESRDSSFLNTSEFDFFFFVDVSSEEIIELEFEYPEENTVQHFDSQVFDIFTQPGIIKMPIEFVFQAFADEQIILKNCENKLTVENISSCSFVAPYVPKGFSFMRKKDVTLPIFEDVVYLEDGKVIRIQFSEELSPVEKSNIVLLIDKNNNKKNIDVNNQSRKNIENIEIDFIKNKKREIEIVLKNPLDKNSRIFYTVLIENFADIAGNAFEQYNVVIAYPKYK